jgi:hypothetical protein
MKKGKEVVTAKSWHLLPTQPNQKLKDLAWPFGGNVLLWVSTGKGRSEAGKSGGQERGAAQGAAEGRGGVAAAPAREGAQARS